MQSNGGQTIRVLQPYKTTQLSNPNIICKKESPKEKVKEKRAK